MNSSAANNLFRTIFNQGVKGKFMKHKQEKSLSTILTNTQTNIGTNERIASVVSGGALLAYGLKRRDTLGILLSVVGGGLALRGTTGHCQIYDALDVDGRKGISLTNWL